VIVRYFEEERFLAEVRLPSPPSVGDCVMFGDEFSRQVIARLWMATETDEDPVALVALGPPRDNDAP
jgi:hypothetical protein